MRMPGRAAHFRGSFPIPRSLTRKPEPLPDGEEGELVLTTLSKQAMPMIRYRTRDITR
jgi:phenylacetate-coenzyme A ligase PaaK-like adenylate-forming protein